jgi:starch-binding outer membrane protein, SusD/RagB family
MKLMKIKYFKQYILVCVLLTSLYSCKKWVEVTPTTQVEDVIFFKTEQGFKDALLGVYIQMGGTSQYGRELTFGLADVLGGMYVLSSTNGAVAYRDAFAGSYTNSGPQGLINGVWVSQYNSIANLNKIISQLSTVDTTIFTGSNYRLIKGEALGLRAFLHFDLLRLFGPSYASATPDSVVAIPYVSTYGTTITPKAKSGIVVQNILADLASAEQLLKTTDPLVTTTGVILQNDRKLRFNYYAVKATQARVNLWINNKPEALKAAQAVIGIGNTKFPWVAQSTIATTTETAKDRVFSTEHIFGLYEYNIATNYVNLLDGSTTQNTLVIDAARLTTQFETATVGASDYRNVYLMRVNVVTPNGNKTFFGKLYQITSLNANYALKMPLLTIPEMYYIASECLKDTDPVTAVQYLNTVRTARGITTALSTSLSSTSIQSELLKEYWKEFTCSGQMWYYYKRFNATSIPGASGTYAASRYVLPLPVDEVTYGL